MRTASAVGIGPHVRPHARRPTARPRAALAVCGALGLLAASGTPPAAAQDAARGAALYLRLADDTRSCVSCHGPDPGTNQNNILRAADSPDTLVKVMNTVAPMGFLRSLLSDADRADVAAFLGTIARLNAPGSPLRAWPVTLEFGTTVIGARSAAQQVRLRNPSSSAALRIDAITAAAPVAIEHDCPASLSAGAGCSITARLQPGASGLLRGALRIDTATHRQVVGFSGYGVATATSELAWDTASPLFDFGTVAVDQPGERTLTLVNPGPLPAVLASTSLTGPDAGQFQVVRPCPPGTLVVAGTTCTMTLRYAGGGRLANAEAMLQLRSDRGNPPALRITASTEPVPGACVRAAPRRSRL